jgi:Protein of unknown function (DUF3347)
MIKRLLLLLLVIILGVAGYVWYQFSTQKGGGFDGEKAVKLEIHSSTPVFDSGITAMMSAYFNMQGAFVNADTAAAKAACSALVTAVDSVKTGELQNDSSQLINTVVPFLNDVKSNAVSLLQQTQIKEMRQDFHQVNQQLYALLKTINYKGATVYWQNCPMAFDGDKEAYWLDTKKGDEKMNPYLGNNDPKYGSGMLHCGEEKDSVVAK